MVIWAHITEVKISKEHDLVIKKKISVIQ